MPSEQLKALITHRRANAYKPSQSIESLRGNGPDGGSVPRPNTTVEVCDADGVYGEWVVCGTPITHSVFIFLHGGGYYRGSAIASRRIASDLSFACGCRCFTVEYRLAPEHPFPVGLDDALTVYHWLLNQGISAKQIVVGGSSAGGGLSAALLTKLKLLGEDQPAAAILLSPWTDLTQSAETFVTNAGSDPTISKGYLDRMAGLYLNGTDPINPLASPVFSDLEGLPPMLVQVGKSETMYGDALAYVSRARESGVSVELEAFDHVPHGWQNSLHVIPDLPEAMDAIKRIGKFFNVHCSLRN
ncbi:MAG: alpha/beta hydrolase [Verrucomicrobia bacterium]|nr:alpha/beta hydrolase [Verrucomicrobiota bacterium]MDA1069424.1 alpha/beta hydrolase [Verrucomicrobiota bacterium]